MARQYLAPGGFINEATARQYLSPGGFINDTTTTSASLPCGGIMMSPSLVGALALLAALATLGLLK